MVVSAYGGAAFVVDDAAEYCQACLHLSEFGVVRFVGGGGDGDGVVLDVPF